MTDAELIEAVRAGDPAALEALWRRYLPSVWRHAYARLDGDHQAVEDVTSETFLAAVRGIQAVDPDIRSLARWLMGIARHKVVDYKQRVSGATVPQATAGKEAVGEAADPVASLEDAERRATVANVLDEMPGDERIALEWKYLDGLSVREIAARLGRTEKAAETILYRARRSFREMFRRKYRPEP